MKDRPDAVLGFLFAGPLGDPWVALIRKDHPDWQKGKFNGLGGHVEYGENPHTTMTREFYEESGLWIVPEQWHHVVIHCGRSTDYTMWVYAAHVDIMARLKTTDTVEPCYWVRVADLPDAVLPNLRWLIPLCLDKRIAEPVVVHYHRPAEDKKCPPCATL